MTEICIDKYTWIPKHLKRMAEVMVGQNKSFEKILEYAKLHENKRSQVLITLEWYSGGGMK